MILYFSATASHSIKIRRRSDFYERMGFETYKRTDLDEEGSPLSAPVYEG